MTRQYTSSVFFSERIVCSGNGVKDNLVPLKLSYYQRSAAIHPNERCFWASKVKSARIISGSRPHFGRSVGYLELNLETLGWLTRPPLLRLECRERDCACESVD